MLPGDDALRFDIRCKEVDALLSDSGRGALYASTSSTALICRKDDSPRPDAASVEETRLTWSGRPPTGPPAQEVPNDQLLGSTGLSSLTGRLRTYRAHRRPSTTDRTYDRL